jgi:hypothetical protein
MEVNSSSIKDKLTALENGSGKEKALLWLFQVG